MELPERVQARLAAETRFRDVRFVAATGSTNRDVMGLALAGAQEGLVVVAEHQTAGRGRLDRRWDAVPGDALLVSVLLRPELPLARRHLVTAAAALAGQDACAQVAGVEASIKWPNDLMVGSAKLAGILAESVLFGPAGDPAAPASSGRGVPNPTPAVLLAAPLSGVPVVVGMGMNVHGGPPGAAVLDELAGRRTSRAELLAAWLTGLDRLAGDWDAVAAAYRQRCATVGRRVRVELSDRVLEGMAEAVDGDGRLMVRADDGRATAVSAGDVTHLR